MKDEVEKLRQQIYEISLTKINDILFVPPGVDGSVGLSNKQLDQILALIQKAQVEAVRAARLDELKGFVKMGKYQDKLDRLEELERPINLKEDGEPE